MYLAQRHGRTPVTALLHVRTESIGHILIRLYKINALKLNAHGRASATAKLLLLAMGKIGKNMLQGKIERQV